MIARIAPGRPITTVVMSELIAMMSDSAIGSPFWPPAPPGGLPYVGGALPPNTHNYTRYNEYGQVVLG